MNIILLKKIFNFKHNYYNILNINNLIQIKIKFYKYKILFFKSLKKKKKYRSFLRISINFFLKIKKKKLKKRKIQFIINGFQWFFAKKKLKEKKFFNKLVNYIYIKKAYFKIFKIRSKYRKLYKKRYKRFKRYKILKLHKYYNKRIKRFLFKSKKNIKFNFLPDELELVDLLKSKFNLIKTDKLINIFGFIYLKSSGINTFITITSLKGRVYLHILQVCLKKLNV
jgi:hypothetical protein